MKKQIFIVIMLMLVFQLKNIDSNYYFDTGNETNREQPIPVPEPEPIE